MNVLQVCQDAPKPAPSINCIKTTHLFSQALATNSVEQFLNEMIATTDFNLLTRSIKIENIDSESATSLEINFFENRLTTLFQGETATIKLSCALGIINDLSYIFTRIKTLKGEKDIRVIEDKFLVALDAKKNSDDELSIKIDDKTGVVVYPLIKRVVLTTNRGQSSVPMQMFQSLIPIFNKKFAIKICPLLEIEPHVESLLAGINKLYLGRCILGVGKNRVTGQRGVQGSNRELNRIVSLIQIPGSAFYTEPLA